MSYIENFFLKIILAAGVVFVLSVLSFIYIWHYNNNISEGKNVIKKGSEYFEVINTSAQIVKYGRSGSGTLGYAYYIKNKRYRGKYSFTDIPIFMGEKFECKYKKDEPRISYLFLDKPVIGISKYINKVALVTKVIKKDSKLYAIKYEYNVDSELITRWSFVKKVDKIKIGKEITISYKEGFPQISYIINNH